MYAYVYHPQKHTHLKVIVKAVAAVVKSIQPYISSPIKSH